MPKNKLECLVLYQDVDIMLKEAVEEEKKLGFHVGGTAQLQKARDEIKDKIDTRYLRTYERLATRHKRPIVPVQDDTCLGCFAKLPTSFTTRARRVQDLYTCENCGRILYWIE